MPLGAIGLVGWMFYTGSKRGDIIFERNPASSFPQFLKKVAAVKSANGAASIVNPPNMHAILKFVLASIGVLCTILGLRSTMLWTSFDCTISSKDPVCSRVVGNVFTLWILGSLLTLLATGLGSYHGRRLVLAVTNRLSVSVGIEYKMHPKTQVITEWHRQLNTSTSAAKTIRRQSSGYRNTADPSSKDRYPRNQGSMGRLGRFLTSLADVCAKFSALTDPAMQQDLRNRGCWKKKDKYSMFYSEYNDNAPIWALFLFLKNLVVGVMLTSCDAHLCAVPCPCGIDAASCAAGKFFNATSEMSVPTCEHSVIAPLLGVHGKVW